MARSLKAAHVDADLGDDDRCRQAANAGDGAEHFDGYTKGFDVAVDLLVDRGDGRVEGVDLVQVQLEQEAVMLGYPAVQ
jgi:hypothetical protein